ncbi:MAG: hypothetical protein SVY10_19615 [Thermodesulfobacteriota bacterium]|nr:hypothetical protein [Thermodesulfobacteriota bacterium]
MLNTYRYKDPSVEVGSARTKLLQAVDVGKALLGVIEGENLPVHRHQSPDVSLAPLLLNDELGNFLENSVRTSCLNKTVFSAEKRKFHLLNQKEKAFFPKKKGLVNFWLPG